MSYLLGTDEAGYGPNLGPLVVTATLWHVDDSVAPPTRSRRRAAATAVAEQLATAATPVESDLYQLLKKAVCSQPAKSGPRRVCWTDSKQLYQTGKLQELERGVAALLALAETPPSCWHELWDYVGAGCPRQRDELPWHTSFNPVLPLEPHDQLDQLLTAVRGCATAAGVRLLRVNCRAISPREFNTLVEQHGNKATALSHVTLGLVQRLVESLTQYDNDEAVWVRCDKHGGRNQYAALLQHFFPDGWVEICQEGRDESHYRFTHQRRPCTVRFCVESERFAPVAVASMMSKYLRELSMRAFNEFWCTRIDGLRPTAGYPGDSTRFKREIATLQAELGIADEALWRCR